MQFLFNGNFFDEADTLFGKENRGFRLGDTILEFVKISNGHPVLMEEHYFNLMASMRIFRMKIPNEYTQDFFEESIHKLCKRNNVTNAKIKITVFRNSDSDLNITSATVSNLIEIESTETALEYSWNKDESEIDIFRDFTVNPSFFSQVNTHKPEEIIARAFMQENGYADLVLLNPDKKIARTLLGIPFLIQGNSVKTPPISSGGIRSVTRNHFCKLLADSQEFDLEEVELFPFELQKTEELFICVESQGIISITKNRNKNYSVEKTKKVFELFNSW